MVAGADGVGKGVDLMDGEHETFGRVLVACAFDTAWVAADQPVIDAGIHDGAQQSATLLTLPPKVLG